MTFTRKAAPKWHRDVPGARWFKADLHVHTIDDHRGGNAKMPPGLGGDPSAPKTLDAYARAFLSAAVQAGIRVLGVTPHSPRAGGAPDTSAVFRIVETWNEADDDDGTPFREKIFAVFPGFEPSFRDGPDGLHLIFLFDPEIQRDRYLRCFDLMMGGVSPWAGEKLQVSSLRADEAFERVGEVLERDNEQGTRAWQMLVLAPHVNGDKGLFRAQKAQNLQLFPHEKIAALELPDDELPEQLLENRPWLAEGMRTYRHALYHASDAYEPASIGKRYTWVKLASPRLAALRQAFVARESRLRIAYERGPDGNLRELASPPDPAHTGRPWLRAVTVRGGASFFGGIEQGRPREVRIELSPDLTCVVGGSMTGKSTLLDGLRVHAGAELPRDPVLAQQVTARAREVLLAGSPDVDLDTPGRDPSASPRERWPAVFFTQGELQRLARDSDAVAEILARLAPDIQQAILNREERSRALDVDLARRARELVELEDKRAEAEQQLARASDSQKALAAFEQAGVDRLQTSSRVVATAGRLREQAIDIVRESRGIAARVRELAPDPDWQENLRGLLAGFAGAPDLLGRHAAVERRAAALVEGLADWQADLDAVERAARDASAELRRRVEHRLVELGLGAEKLAELRALSERAGLAPSYRAALEQVTARAEQASATFEALRRERRGLVEEQRAAYGRVMEVIDREFGGRIRARRREHGRSEPLETFVRELKQKGITQWWNGLAEDARPTPDELSKALEEGELAALGMSGAVSARFEEAMTASQRYRLASLRCPDVYLLEMRVAENKYRDLGKLSGGQRVNVLLSLLLETYDDRPLVIDQPEDELDNAFLTDTVLPALLRLKGRRQVVVATHNANIVVNGDADLVVALEATADRGRVAVSGAIEEPAVRDAVVSTVDGGREAFQLRMVKYGF